jgi:hypothetical protein
VQIENVSPPEVCQVQVQCTNNDAVTPKKGKLESLQENSLYTETPKYRLVIKSKPKRKVDYSVLGLLSNSIKHLERVRYDGNRRHRLDRSVIKGRVLFPKEETHTNNMNSSLGVLCDSREQRFMEKVEDITYRKSNLENFDAESCAVSALLNLGRANNVPENERKTSDKRRYVQENLQDFESLKRFKTDGELEDEEPKYDSYSEDDDYDKRSGQNEQEMSVSITNANNDTSESLEFSTENDICTDNEDNDMLNDAPLASSSPCHNVNYEREEDFEEYERKIYEQLYGLNHMSETSSSKEYRFADY